MEERISISRTNARTSERTARVLLNRLQSRQPTPQWPGLDPLTPLVLQSPERLSSSNLCVAYG